MDLCYSRNITVIYLYFGIEAFVPFNGLTQEHYDFSDVIQAPAVVWHATTISELSLALNRRVPVVYLRSSSSPFSALLRNCT